MTEAEKTLPGTINNSARAMMSSTLAAQQQDHDDMMKSMAPMFRAIGRMSRTRRLLKAARAAKRKPVTRAT